MPLTPWVQHVLRTQDGVITLAQAVEGAISARTVARWASTGEWERLAPGVFLAGGHPYTDAARVRAAGLSAGARAAVAGPAAAWWHDMLRDAPRDVDVTVPRCCAPRARPGIRIRRRDLSHLDLVGLRGLWLTAAPLAALEAAAAVPDGSMLLDRALQRHVSFERVYAAYCRNMSAAGFGRVAELLVASADRADSAAERLMHRLLRAAGISGWVPAHPFGPYRIDVAFPAELVAVEVDGWAWHVDVEHFRADRHKGNALVRAGWELLRFTWHDLSNRPQYVVAEIRAALARPAA